MKYVKIRGKSYNEALQKLRSEHGDEAIPISHKYVKEGGLMNSRFFSKQVVEVTAGIPEQKSSVRKGGESKRIDITVGDKDILFKKGGPDNKKKSSSSNDREIDMESINRTIDALNSNLNSFITRPQETEKNKPALSSDRADKDDRDPAATDILKRLIERSGDESMEEGPVMAAQEKPLFLKSEKEMDAITERKPGFERNERNEKTETAGKAEGNERNEKNSTAKIKNTHGGHIYQGDGEHHLKKFDDILKDNDYNDDQRKNILANVKNSISRDDLRDQFKIEKTLKEFLKSRIITTGPITRSAKKKIIMFIGPTGVGKTTTMAKLGAIHSLREGQRVVFITIDNYRIAATEQLKKYAEIMRIPIHSVNDQKEFKDIIDREKADIIMVDTSGRSHKNHLKISEVRDFTNLEEYEIEKILCVSANIKKKDLEEVFKAFDVMNFSSVIITKVDETSFVGNIVDIADKYSKPISYFTFGQEVPNDIEIADSDKIVDMLFDNMYN